MSIAKIIKYEKFLNLIKNLLILKIVIIIVSYVIIKYLYLVIIILLEPKLNYTIITKRKFNLINDNKLDAKFLINIIAANQIRII